MHVDMRWNVLVLKGMYWNEVSVFILRSSCLLFLGDRELHTFTSISFNCLLITGWNLRWWTPTFTNRYILMHTARAKRPALIFYFFLCVFAGADVDTIWDLNINRSRITSPEFVPSASWRHRQLHKVMKKIAISSQFPPALPLRLLKRTLASFLFFFWLAAVYVERGETHSALFIHWLFIAHYFASLHRSAVKM